MQLKRLIKHAELIVPAFLLLACDTATQIKEPENTPTSGKLKVYFESGLEKHVRNQAYTFTSIYYKAELNLVPSSNARAIQALYLDSCESIVITRQLNSNEQRAFASKHYSPSATPVAKTGMAVICNASFPQNTIRYADVCKLFLGSNTLQDSLGLEHQLNLLVDKGGSAVYDYIRDSLLHGQPMPAYLSSLNSGTEALGFVATHTNAIAFIDFALISDVDDSLVKSHSKTIKVLAVGAKQHNGRYEKPNQSSFKLNTYPFTQNIYVVRKNGDFTLAKGFESFVAGPKGQTILLKQGLLPSRQQERSITVNFESLDVAQ